MHTTAIPPKISDPTKRAKAKESVKCRELSKKHSQRKAGYLWIVETRIDGKRSRKFFRHDESAKRDEFIADETARIGAVAKSDRALATDEDLLKEAIKAHNTLQPYKKDLAAAVSFYIQHLDAMAKHDATPLSAVVKRFLDEKEREGLSEVHRADLKNRLARFELVFGEKPIGGIHRNDVADWLGGLPLSPQSKINFRRVLGNLFSYAVRAGNVEVNPVTATNAPKTRRKKAIILTPEEVAQVLTASPAAVLPAQALMVFCGVRNREMFRLDWSAVDWEDGTLEITAEDGKREGHARHVTIPANALEWIRPLAKKRGKIFQRGNLSEAKEFAEFTRRLQDARALAGWDVGKWPANALRKTFISCHYETHGSIDGTAKQAGTSVAMIDKHYRKLIKKRDADKLWKIGPAAGPDNVISMGQPTVAEADETATGRKSAVVWPAPADLQAMLWQRPVVDIARDLGVSDVAVVKHAAKHGLTKPPRGYWLKQSSEGTAR
jgi:integrase